ncbi:protein of unknown function [Candidatus Promineifilum breve]|uniref:Uncharacterized protein n=1 Tax=Candidatus Promineifilum breve TaxID=1806508 RepID=A0A160T2F3_9CHLR|nr:protein of unknown function [Candidatus Promineifilum breve]
MGGANPAFQYPLSGRRLCSAVDHFLDDGHD